MALTSPKVSRPISSGESAGKVATNWLFFGLVMGLSLANYLFGLALDGVEAATAATVVALPISILCMILGGATSFSVGILEILYNIYTRKYIITKIIISGITSLLAMIPVIDIIPFGPGGFVVSCLIGGIAATTRGLLSETGKKAAGKVASYAGGK